MSSILTVNYTYPSIHPLIGTTSSVLIISPLNYRPIFSCYWVIYAGIIIISTFISFICYLIGICCLIFISIEYKLIFNGNAIFTFITSNFSMTEPQIAIFISIGFDSHMTLASLLLYYLFLIYFIIVTQSFSTIVTFILIVPYLKKSSSTLFSLNFLFFKKALHSTLHNLIAINLIAYSLQIYHLSIVWYFIFISPIIINAFS